MITATGKKVLVVDDEIYLREIVAFDLKEAGYDVEQAENGQAAIKAIKESSYDLVISDVRMPNGTGVELLGWVKEWNPLFPSFIFMTAFSDISSEEALALGAEAFLNKPFELDLMIDAVKEAVVNRMDRWSRPWSGESSSFRLLTAQPHIPLLSDPIPNIVLGGGGMFLELDGNFPSSLEIVGFSFEHDGVLLEGEGRVRWVRHESTPQLPSGIGLEFLYLSEASRAAFLKYLQTARPSAYIPRST